MDNFDRNHEKLMLRETIVKDIVVAMAMMFRTILEAESENGISGRSLSKTVLTAMKMELEQAIEKEKKRK